MTTPVPVLTIKLTKPGVELVLSALAQLPYTQSAGVIREIEAQANAQLELLQRAVQAARVEEPQPAKEGE